MGIRHCGDRGGGCTGYDSSCNCLCWRCVFIPRKQRRGAFLFLAGSFLFGMTMCPSCSLPDGGPAECPYGQRLFLCHVEYPIPAMCLCPPGTEVLHTPQCGYTPGDTAEGLRSYLSGMYPSVQVWCQDAPAGGLGFVVEVALEPEGLGPDECCF